MLYNIYFLCMYSLSLIINSDNIIIKFVIIWQIKSKLFLVKKNVNDSQSMFYKNK